MKIRNGKYTKIYGAWLEVIEIRDDHDNVLIKHEGFGPPDSTFQVSEQDENIFYKKTLRSQIDIFEIRTKAFCSGFEVDVYQTGRPDIVNIGTNDQNIIEQLRLEEGYKGYFMKEVSVDSVSNLVERIHKIQST